MNSANNIPIVPTIALPNTISDMVSGENLDLVRFLTFNDANRLYISGLAWSYSQPPSNSKTSGHLVKGRWYTITTYVGGDDFTNVGAESNANGVVFRATGTIPTTWTHASVLTFPGSISLIINASYTYIFDQDITQDGPGVIYFRPAKLITSDAFVLLASGGPGCIGKVNCLGVAPE